MLTQVHRPRPITRNTDKAKRMFRPFALLRRCRLKSVSRGKFMISSPGITRSYIRLSKATFDFKCAISSARRGRHCPGSSPWRVSGPELTRIRRSVGYPTAAVIRRTWRFLPSVSFSSSQEVGIDLRNRTGGSRGGTSGSAGNSRTFAGRDL
jgi:hypothetical protein